MGNAISIILSLNLRRVNKEIFTGTKPSLQIIDYKDITVSAPF